MSEKKGFSFRNKSVITLYANDVKTFFEEVETRSLGPFLRDMYETGFGYSMPQSAVAEIRYMLESIAGLLKDFYAGPDVGVRLELVRTNECEFAVMMLCSADSAGTVHISYTLLLPWDTAVSDGNRNVLFREYESDHETGTEHPSLTVLAYSHLVSEMLEGSGSYDIKPCVLFYNAVKNAKTDIVSFADIDLISAAPVFYITDKNAYSDYIKSSVNHNDGIRTVLRITGIVSDAEKKSGRVGSVPEQDVMSMNPVLCGKYEKIVSGMIGAEAWGKLNEECRSWLMTAFYSFGNLNNTDRTLDFSGVVLQVCKVIETYLAGRMVYDYMMFLSERLPKKDFVLGLPNRLKMEQDGELIPINSKYFTLGIVPYIMGMSPDGSIDNQRDYELFKLFLLECGLEQNEKEHVDELMLNIVLVTDYIRVYFRNSSAHNGFIGIDVAEDCIKYCFKDGNRVGKIINAFAARDVSATFSERVLQVCIPDGTSVRLDKWLPGTLMFYSRGSVRKAIDEGYVSVNGRIAVCNCKVVSGDKVEVSGKAAFRRSGYWYGMSTDKYGYVKTRIRILAVGRTDVKSIKKMNRYFSSRLSEFCELTVTEVEACSVTCEHTPEVIEEIVNTESERLKRYLENENAYKVLLDTGGGLLSSEDIAEMLRNAGNGAGSLVFVIGGQHGVSDEIKAMADLSLSLSRMTFSHLMARCILLEQLFRGYMILEGRPYHW